MPASTVYFGDLLTTLDRMGLAGQFANGEQSAEAAEKVSQIAAAFGMEWQMPQPREPQLEELPHPPKKEPESPPESSTEKLTETPEPQRLEFWTVLRKRTRAPEEVDQPPEELRNVPLPSPDKWSFRGAPPKGAPLMPWSRLWPVLRRILGHERPSRSPDMPRLVRALALGQPLHRLPRRRRSAWCPEVTILVDRRTAMSPFLDDFDDIIARIRTLRGSGGLRVIHARADVHGLLSDTTLEPLQLPRDVSATALLALGDLGQYAGGLLSHAWIGWGRKARSAGFTPWALCPCPQDRWIPAAAHAWNAICWDRHSRPPQVGAGQQALPWAADEQETAVERRSGQLHTLFRLVSPAIRVERGFLRDVRFLLDHRAADAGTEYDAFQSQDAVGSGEGLSLTPARQRQLRAELGQKVPSSLLADMLHLLRHHHAYSASVFGAEELEGLKECLPPALHPLLEQSRLLTPESEALAALHWRQIAAGLLGGRFGRHQEAMKGYAMRGLSRIESTIADSAAKQVIWALNHADHAGEYPNYLSPSTLAFLQKRNRVPSLQSISVVDGLRVGAIPPNARIQLASLYTYWQAASLEVDDVIDGTRKLQRTWQDTIIFTPAELRQISRIRIDAGIQAVELGRLTRPLWASRMWYENSELKAKFSCQGKEYLFERTWNQELAAIVDSTGVTPVDSSGVGLYANTGWQASAWSCPSPPSWASSLWADKYGLAAEFYIRDVPFVLRWIPPGSFRMGSPEDEPGRYKNEGPQHRVTISKGYWMAETPVTQAQWRAVVEATGVRSNRGLVSKLNPAPSHFKGPPDLPVESVSWVDSTTFCRLMDALLPDGPGFHLPTEAQWEYACRAGEPKVPFHGPIRQEAEVLSPDLEDYAWYGGNSGKDCVVSNPQDSSTWLGIGKGSSTAGTHPVKTKRPNGTGLHDMLGNVREWCADVWDEQAYAKRADGVKDPRLDSTDDRADRIVRGGSWSNQAQNCRAACRLRRYPGNRDFPQGLRLAAGGEQKGEEMEQQTNKREVGSPAFEERHEQRDSRHGPFTRADTY
jgi:formylglycine-generating enzyme required for sulfatase activity